MVKVPDTISPNQPCGGNAVQVNIRGRASNARCRGEFDCDCGLVDAGRSGGLGVSIRLDARSLRFLLEGNNLVSR